MSQLVFMFSTGQAEGGLENLEVLGNKGARLADMARLGVPVPPGFTISSEVCQHFQDTGGEFPAGLREEVAAGIGRLEQITGRGFGYPANPLLLSARSGAAISMPGMMDSILNLGLNHEVVDGLARQRRDPRFAWDCYRRALEMFGTTIEELDEAEFDRVLAEERTRRGVGSDWELNESDMRRVAERFEEIYQRMGKQFPSDPEEQLFKAIEAVLHSWNSPRALTYRRAKKIPDTCMGTAVTIQTMVFGNRGDSSATGVVFSRNISTGENRLDGEYLIKSQGEDVVAGIRTPFAIEEMKNTIPAQFEELKTTVQMLGNHYGDVQDIEFTIEEGKLYILQSRTAKRTPSAAVRIAVEMVEEGKISREEALSRITVEQLEQMVSLRFDPAAEKRSIGSGLSVTPGIAVGRAVFCSSDAIEWARRGEKVVLVREKTSPVDMGGIEVADGILTKIGGASSHASIVCRDLAKVGIVGCAHIAIDHNKKEMCADGVVITQGDWISLDGTSGEVLLGAVPTVNLAHDENLKKLSGWAADDPSAKAKLARILRKVSQDGEEHQ